MNRLQRVGRLHAVKRQLLKRCEQQQRVAERYLMSQEQTLEALGAWAKEAARAQATAKTAADLLAWQHYLDYLQNHEMVEKSELNRRQQVVSDRKIETVLAYQDAERWDHHEQRERATWAVQLQTATQKTADEMAVSRRGPYHATESGGAGLWQ